MNRKYLDHQFETILSRRTKAKTIRYTAYLILFLLILWSVESTVIKDTDWERIGGLASLFKAVGRFFPPDLTLFKYLAGPTIETFMIACLGTLIAVILSIPVAWCAAMNITPSKLIAYPIGPGHHDADPVGS